MVFLKILYNIWVLLLVNHSNGLFGAFLKFAPLAPLPAAQLCTYIYISTAVIKKITVDYTVTSAIFRDGKFISCIFLKIILLKKKRYFVDSKIINHKVLVEEDHVCCPCITSDIKKRTTPYIKHIDTIWVLNFVIKQFSNLLVTWTVNRHHSKYEYVTRQSHLDAKLDESKIP